MDIVLSSNEDIQNTKESLYQRIFPTEVKIGHNSGVSGFTTLEDMSNNLVENPNGRTFEFFNGVNNICICEELDQYEERCIYFCEPIKNNIINDGNFIRILYSKPFVLLNGIYLCFSLNIISVEKYYNKLKCNFNKSEHMDIIEKCKEVEEGLLKKVNSHLCMKVSTKNVVVRNNENVVQDTNKYVNKIAQYKIFEQFKNGNIKIFNENLSKESSNPLNKFTGPCSFLLKISGVWENDMYYGVTFKFLKGDILSAGVS